MNAQSLSALFRSKMNCSLSLLYVIGLVVTYASPSQERSSVEDPSVTPQDELPIAKTANQGKNISKGLKIAEIEEEYIPVERPEPKVTYEGSQVLRLILDTKDKKKVIAKLRDAHEISMWGGNQSAVDVLVKESAKNTVLNRLDVNTINYEVIIDNVQKAIDEENPQEDNDELQNRHGHQMTWSYYHRIDTIYGFLDYLSIAYPRLVSSQVIGTSVKGRPLKLVKISNGKVGNRAIWVDGGMHAREWISPAVVTFIVKELVLKNDEQPTQLQNVDWYFLPVANPDGYEYSHETDRLWRKNRAQNGLCYGTDLNRNFGYKWGGRGSGHNPCQDIYAGTAPFSEPETNSIRNYISNTKANWLGYVSFHSYGQYILYPWGFDRVVTTDYDDLNRVGHDAASAIRRLSGSIYTTGPAGSTLYPASGGSDDWAKGSMRMKYAYTIELRDTGRHGFILPSAQIEPTADEAFVALKVIALAVSSASI